VPRLGGYRFGFGMGHTEGDAINHIFGRGGDGDGEQAFVGVRRSPGVD
jgi:hypothetical protein